MNDQGYDCSTVIGLGVIAGATVLLLTKNPVLALLAQGFVKVLLPERGDTREKRAERAEKLFEVVVEAAE